MARIYRAMTAESGKPAVGQSARKLGIRPGTDIDVHPSGNVLPGNNGMSVAPYWWSLEAHRIPKRFLGREYVDETGTARMLDFAAGSNNDELFRMGSGSFAEGPLTAELSLVVDVPGKHGVVSPARIMTLTMYEASLAATRDQWEIEPL